MNSIWRLGVGAVLALSASAAGAAGMVTHAAMAEFGRDALEDGALKTILSAHRAALIAGAIHPDGGYGSGALFASDRDVAERAHWGDFTVIFIQYLRDTGCSGEVRAALIARPPVATVDLAQLTDRCGHLIAFAFGNAAHGLTDETWDAQFEPEVRRRGEDPNVALLLQRVAPQLPPALSQALGQLYGATPLNGIEYAMDMVHIVDKRLLLNAPTLVFPPATDLVEVYRRNRPDQGVTALMIERAQVFSRTAVQAESTAAPLDVARIRLQMPWASSNYYTAPGGVAQSGYAVAGMYRQLWNLLTGDPAQPLPPTVIGSYPGHGAVDVRLEPAGDRSWSQHRWLHVFFSTSVDPASLELPGALCLFDERGARVAGVVEPGIYQREFTHTAKLRLTQALQPGKRYTAVVTPKVRDYRGVPLERAYSFSFVTAAD